ncbi:MAG: hypothetical protein M3N98_16050 [Actinomycetota bacterium]|nr:hypothetical protein [Actinomycetota bacterium]
MATLTRLIGRLDMAEDAVQEACAVALDRWPAQGVPANPGAWLIGTARNKAIDRLRREGQRVGKEAAAMRDLNLDDAGRPMGDDQLSLLFMCCHPALARDARVALTLRSLGGLSTAEIAAAFLVAEPTMAKRLVRAKQKISQAGIPFRVPARDQWADRMADVLRVIYLIFTEGHMATSGPNLVRDELCDTAVDLGRQLSALVPDEPEAAGLLALLLLTDARRPSRTDADGNLVLLEDQDRSRWDPAKIGEGERLLEQALRSGRPGPYQLWAAIAACHSTAPSAAATDWGEIAALYRRLVGFEPSPVVEANRAVAVSMSEGPSAGLDLLDAIATRAQLARWPQLHIARADLLRRLNRVDDAIAAYQAALDLDPAEPERAFIAGRMHQLAADRDSLRPAPGRSDAGEDPMDRNEARELLGTERDRVQQLLDDAASAARDDTTAANEPGDMTDSAEPLTAEQTDNALAAALTARLEAIERAEQRLVEGTYGRSVRSGVPIPDERLRADPAAELTVDEAQDAH